MLERHCRSSETSFPASSSMFTWHTAHTPEVEKNSARSAGSSMTGTAVGSTGGASVGGTSVGGISVGGISVGGISVGGTSVGGTGVAVGSRLTASGSVAGTGTIW